LLLTETVNILIKQLADGDFHSGEELGRLLGISRAAVWKHLKKLENLGLHVESVKGQGYCLSGGLDLLDELQICNNLDKDAVPLLTLNLHGVVQSTNTMALEQAEQGPCSGYVFLAEQQTAGRGRRGRSWISPFARNIYLSMVWGFDQGAASLEGLSLAVGVAVRRAITKAGIDGVQLKWPNDILYQRRKLGGILLEMIGDPAGFCQVIIGIGLNVSMPAEHGSEIDQEWVDLEAIQGVAVRRNHLVAMVLNELVLLLSDYQSKGFAAVRDEWQCHDAFRGEVVSLETPSFKMTGIASGISESGAICLKVGDEYHYFNGGEISLRRAS
jgi:BirA family biotin operon repressor/biotin-[acetyl-CoA-carboxylase] ligase